jgi:hypothetical protein
MAWSGSFTKLRQICDACTQFSHQPHVMEAKANFSCLNLLHTHTTNMLEKEEEVASDSRYHASSKVKVHIDYLIAAGAKWNEMKCAL